MGVSQVKKFIVFSIICLILPVSVFAACVEWVDVDGTGLEGVNISNTLTDSIWPEFELDANDRSHVIWRDGATNDVYYRKWDGVSWVDVDGVGIESSNVSNIGDVHTIDIELDSNNKAHLSYTKGTSGAMGVYYIKDVGGVFVDADGVGIESSRLYATDNSYGARLALDNLDFPYITWQMWPSPSDIFMLKYDGLSWLDVDGTGIGEINVSGIGTLTHYETIEIDSLNNPNVSYVRESGGDIYIYFQKWNGSAWVGADGSSNKLVTSMSGNNGYPYMILDSSGNPHITWNDGSNVYYTKWDGSAWVDVDGIGTSDIVVSQSGSTATNISIDIDSVGNPHIIWCEDNGVSWDVVYVEWNGSDWVDSDGSGRESEVIANAPMVAGIPIVKIDSTDRAWVLWADNSSGNNEIYMMKQQDCTITPTSTITITENLTATVTPTICDYYGNTNGASYLPLNGDMIAARVYLPAGTLNTIVPFVQGPGTAHIKAGLYSDNAGEPENLLAMSFEQSVMMGQNYLAVSTPYTISSDGYYWIVLQSDDPAVTVRYEPSTGDSRNITLPFDTWPDPLVGTGTTTHNWVMEANVCGVLTNTPTVTPTATQTITTTPDACEGIGSVELVSPMQVIAGSSGNTIVLKYTAGSETWSSIGLGGYIKVSMPSGWEQIMIGPVTEPGYTTNVVTGGTYNGASVSFSENAYFVMVDNLLADTGTITFTIGDMSSGGPGLSIPAGLGNGCFKVEVDVDGSDGLNFCPVNTCLEVEVIQPTLTVTQTITDTIVLSQTATYSVTPTITFTYAPAVIPTETSCVYRDAAFSEDGVTTHHNAAGGDSYDTGYNVITDDSGNVYVGGASIGVSGWDMTVWKYTASGDLDTTFGGTGYVTINNVAGGDNLDIANDITIDSSGRVIITGHSSGSGYYEMGVCRYNTNGTLDTTFNGIGYISYNISGHEYGRSVVVDSGGKIVVVGSVGGDIIIRRLNDNGTLDTTFNTVGYAIFDGGQIDEAYDVIIDSYGRYLVVGMSESSINGKDTIVCRYNSNGLLDTTFNGIGYVIYDGDTAGSDCYGNAIATDNDDGIIVTGYDSTMDDIILLRYDDNGILDTSFYSLGYSLPGNQYGSDVVISNTGKIFVSGFIDEKMAVWKFNSDGTSDASFNGAGIYTYNVCNAGGTSCNHSGLGLVIDDSGHILVAGTNTENALERDMAVWRLIDVCISTQTQTVTPTVTPTITQNVTAMPISTETSCVHRDDTFDSDGITMFDSGSHDEFKTIVEDGSGRYITAGYTAIGMGVWRYNSDGTLDTIFNSGSGYVSGFGTAGGIGKDYAYDMLIDSNNKIVVVGSSNASSTIVDNDAVIWRFNPDGTPDTSFNGVGYVVMPEVVPGMNSSAHSVAVDAVGNIIAVGTVEDISGQYLMVVWKYLPNGTLDTSFNGLGFLATSGGAGPGGSAADIVIDSNGKYVVSGYYHNATDYDMAVWRVETTGVLDTLFGTMSGRFEYDGGFGDDYGNSLVIDGSGSILVTGQSSNGADADLIIIKLDDTGALDTAFGTGGVVTDDSIAGAGGLDAGNDIEIDGTGKIVITGEGGGIGVSNPEMALWKFNPDGTLDTDFNGTGYIMHGNAAGGNNHDYANKFIIDSSGDYVIAGMSENPTDNDAVIWRYIDECTVNTPTSTPSTTPSTTPSATPSITHSTTPSITHSITQTITQTQTTTSTYTITPTVPPTNTITQTMTSTLTPTITPTATLNIIPVDLNITKLAEGEKPAVGAEIIYSIIIENDSNQAVASLAVWDTLPDRVEFIGGIETTLVPTPDINNVIRWDMEDLPAHTSFTFQFRVEILSIADEDPIVNGAACDYDNIYTGIRHTAIYSDLAFYPVGQVLVFPNPFNPDTAREGCLKFTNLVPDSSVEIYTLSGEFVWKKIKTSGITIKWNAENRWGNRISPGIYYYIVFNAGLDERSVGKIFVVSN